MRIISGTHKGRKIIPPNNLPVRPTTDKAKEGLFNIISNRYYFTNKNMLDLFSGTGSIAFEFTSRGGEEAVAIDNNSLCIEFIKNTATNLNLNINSIQADAIKYVSKCNNQFDFIFADPPYNFKKYEELKTIIINQKIIKKNGILIIEHDKDTKFTDNNIEIRKYGTINFSLFSF